MDILQREQIIDRFQKHTRNCASCRRAYVIAKWVRMAAVVIAVAAVAVAPFVVVILGTGGRRTIAVVVAVAFVLVFLVLAGELGVIKELAYTDRA